MSAPRRLRLGVLTTHPIQYQVPWFRELAHRGEVDLTVFYAMIPDKARQGAGFGVAFEWDVPLLDGYTYEVLENVAADPSVMRFGGCDTPGIARRVRDGRFDAFIVNGWVVKSCLQLLWACRRHGVPCIVRGEANGLRRRAAWKRMLHRWLLSMYDACLYIGEANRRFYADHGVRPAALFRCPYGVDNTFFERACGAAGARRDTIRAAWGIPTSALVFLFCGKFEAKKRPLDLLQAFRSALPAAEGARRGHVLMCGDGAMNAQCRQVVHETGLPVTFTGFLNQSQIVDAYVAADCLVLPSDAGETWGLVVNEAMACGRPAIVSDQVGCAEDLIVAGSTGATYPCGDTAALGALLRALMEDPSRCAAMGVAARQRVAGHSVGAVVDGVMSAMQYAVAQR